MARELHSAFYHKIRHRVTGLFLSTKRQAEHGFVWSSRGKLFRNQKSLHKFLRGLPEIPKEWEVVPLELVIRDDRAMNARSYIEFWKSRLKGKKKR